MIPLKNMAILYRTNYQSRAIEENLLKGGLPYKLVGGFRFYERKEIKDIISYLRFCFNTKDELSLGRIINIPNRKMGPKAVADMHSFAREVDLTLGEFIIGAYTTINQEYKDKCELSAEKLAKIEAINSKWNKYITTINLFGNIYYYSKGKDLLEIIDYILESTRYIHWFDDGSEKATMQKENITELKNVASSYSTKYGTLSLEMFLNEINLIEQEQDKNQDGSGNYINMMTIHSSKGLEFDYVFIIGVEEGLLPHSRSFVEERELEEERRLCYVGITRAKQKLFLTFAEKRLSRDGFSSQIPSRFLGEIPQDICEYYSYESYY